MSDLPNSTRTLHKATYVPIQASPREARELQNTGRAFQKLNLLRALAPTTAELKRVRPARGEGGARGRVVAALLRAQQADAVNAPDAARELAKVDATQLVQVADAIVAERRRAGAVVAETLQTIRKRIDERREQLEAPGRAAADFSVQELFAWAATNDRRLLQPVMNTVIGTDIGTTPLQFSPHGTAISLYEPDALRPIEHALAGFQQSLQIEPVGRLYLERMEMYPVSIERGELIGTVPLAPQETVTISHKEWSTSSEEFEKIVQDSFEGYSEKGVAEKNDASMASESESRHSNSVTFGASLSGGFAGVTVSTNLGLADSSDQRESLRRSISSSREVTQKASARTRKEHKITFKLEAKRGASDESFRTITNPSPTTSMRIDYFRLMRRWRTDLYQYGLRMTYDIVIPNPGAALWAKYEELADIERQLNEPLIFTTKPSDITETTWPALAAQYGAKVDPPPAKKVQLTQSRELREPPGGLTSIEFVAPAGYTLDSEVAVRGSFLIEAGGSNLGIAFSGNATIAITPGGSVVGGGTFKAGITNALNGDRSALFVSYAGGQVIGLNVSAGASAQTAALEAWRTRTFEALQEGALQAYVARGEKLRDRRQQLIDELGKFDALTLRRMEREEIIRGTLQWLFGPQFTVAPPAIATIIDSILTNANSPVTSAGELKTLSTADWVNVLSFGEFVKFLHQAVEWESVLFLLYPYFWGSPALAKQKRFFLHPDPLHRDFLRAGFARVVLTIRPGFEQSFTQLLETGAFGTLPNNHPYMTIASEIAAFAHTNYPGIPPANSEKNARPLLYPQQRTTWLDMQRIVKLLDAFAQSNNGKYPAKLSQLSGGPFKDAWGNDYVYRMPGTSGEYDLISLGEDAKDGGDELNADISSAADASLVARWFDYTPTSGIDIQLNSAFPQIA